MKTMILSNPNHIIYGNRVCVKSGISMSKSNLNDAYKQVEPSKFVIEFCYGLFGYEMLSKSCVRDQKNTQGCTELPDREVRVMTDHFQFWMATNNYTNDHIRSNILKVNLFCRRAINSSKRKIRNCGKIPSKALKKTTDEMVEL